MGRDTRRTVRTPPATVLVVKKIPVGSEEAADGPSTEVGHVNSPAWVGFLNRKHGCCFYVEAKPSRYMGPAAWTCQMPGNRLQPRDRRPRIYNEGRLRASRQAGICRRERHGRSAACERAGLAGKEVGRSAIPSEERESRWLNYNSGPGRLMPGDAVFGSR